MRCIMASVHEELRLDLPFTGGVYGAVNTLRRILDAPGVRADLVVIGWDDAPPPRRCRLVPGYKQDRPEKKRDLFPSPEVQEQALAQIWTAYEAFEQLGCVNLRYRKREGDDCIAAAAQELLAQDRRPLVVTGDHDLWQMVQWGARVWDLGEDEIVDASNFVHRTGVSTDTFVLFKALIGDTSDNIKGVHGLGPKKAAALLERAHWWVRLRREPLDQLGALCQYIGGLPNRGRVDARVLTERRRLENVIRAIDLREGFGPRDSVSLGIQTPPEGDLWGFLRLAKRHGLQGIVDDHARFTRPFLDARDRRRKQEIREKVS